MTDIIQSYSVPDDLAQYIDIISPTTYFGEMKAQAVLPNGETEDITPTLTTRDEPTQPQLNPACTTTYVSARTGKHYDLLTPQCINELYNTGGYKADPKSGSNIAFANFLNETPSYRDLDLFEKAFKIPEQNFTVLALLNGGVNDQNPLTETDGEANLDVQNIVGLVDGLPIYTYITGGKLRERRIFGCQLIISRCRPIHPRPSKSKRLPRHQRAIHRILPIPPLPAKFQTPLHLLPVIRRPRKHRTPKIRRPRLQHDRHARPPRPYSPSIFRRPRHRSSLPRKSPTRKHHSRSPSIRTTIPSYLPLRHWCGRNTIL